MVAVHFGHSKVCDSAERTDRPYFLAGKLQVAPDYEKNSKIRIGLVSACLYHNEMTRPHQYMGPYLCSRDNNFFLVTASFRKHT